MQQFLWVITASANYEYAYIKFSWLMLRKCIMSEIFKIHQYVIQHIICASINISMEDMTNLSQSGSLDTTISILSKSWTPLIRAPKQKTGSHYGQCAYLYKALLCPWSHKTAPFSFSVTLSLLSLFLPSFTLVPTLAITISRLHLFYLSDRKSNLKMEAIRPSET